jgi:phosphate transport system ATP-binding protein
MAVGIQINNLEVAFARKKVICNVNLDIPLGKITALIGPSGCGKTTILRCINRLADLNPECRVNGSISLDGQDIEQLDPIIVRRRIGMVFQKPNPFPKTISENVLYGVKAINHRKDYEELLESSLKQAALWDEVKDRLKENAMTLSVGQQQRLCIARCLAVTPEAILMDEPTASLDPTSSAKVEESIRALKGTYTVIIVTHNMQQAVRVSDHTAFVYLGNVVEFGPTDRIFNDPQRKETRDYINGRFG